MGSPELVYNASYKTHGQRFRVWYKVKNALERNAKLTRTPGIVC